jgi:hypothetical protein
VPTRIDPSAFGGGWSLSAEGAAVRAGLVTGVTVARVETEALPDR